MPLFESLEGDAAAFFVSQGSVFDALVRSFMERMARVETRVDALATDMSANFQSVNQLTHAVSAAVDAHAAAAALARLEQQSNANAESGSASIGIANSSGASDAMSPAADPTNHMDTHELEYYIMTLSRQLHVVLELFFQPYAHDAGSGIQAKQAQFETISDVLTQNEVILMQLSAMGAQHPDHNVNGDQQQDVQQLQREEVRREVDTNNHYSDGSVSIRKDSAIDPILETHKEVNDDDDDDADKEEQSPGEVIAVGITPIEPVESEPEQNIGILEDEEDADPDRISGTDQAPSSEGPMANRVVSEPQVESRETPPIPGTPSHVDGAPNRHKSMEVEVPEAPAKRKPNTHERERRRTGKDASLHHPRKKSLYDSFRDFHELQLSEEERQRLREHEVLCKVQQLLQSAKKQWQQEITSTLAFAWQQKVQELEHQQLKMQNEWQYHQRPHDLVLQQQQQQQLEFDRQFMTFSASFLTAQQAQEQQIARILESLREFQDQHVQKADFDRMASAWLQTARDKCVFGVNAEALTAFKQEMEEFQNQLSNQELSSPLMEKLLEEVANVLELLNKVLGLLGSDGDGLHGLEGFQVMQTLRAFLTMLDGLTQNLESDKDASVKSAAFISETLRQMELGTANLLDAFESQQDRYQQAFEQQQLAIAQLQRELWDQRQADQELKSQLAGCPSQEDTMRFIQELRDQINASSADSATRMLETVDELRLRMGGLPNAEVIDRLTQAVQKKADRAEMDRLERLLAAANSGPVAPVGSLMKAPMKCLSCDQNLLYAHTSSDRGSSSPEHHGGSHSHQHQHTCSHDHVEQTPQMPQYYYYTQPPGSPEPAAPGFKELFATSTAAASRRRKQRQLNLALSVSQNNWSDGVTQSRALFVNLDDGRNRIPLRRTVLSDQVVYGPAITPNAFKKRGFGPTSRFDTSEQTRTSRPKTAVLPDRRGEIITRSISSTVVIRPFAEQLKDPTTDKRAKH